MSYVEESDPRPSHRPTLLSSVVRTLERLTDFLYFAAEYIVLPRISLEGPGPFSRLLFSLPMVLYRLGLMGLIGRHVLVLTTIGRNSGKPRLTPLGYSIDDGGSYYVSAGWEGRVNWYRNVRINPNVHVSVGNLEFDAVVGDVDERVAMLLLADYIRRNPFASRLCSQLFRVPFDGSEESMRRVIAYFPTVELRRLK